ncbi:MAG: SDR family NAD(P)-dependent oxidoreductase [Gammaproteobacteria bacterium]|nr:SDR family NAD(P)-dependent oxidoreductase [Gammaproteobacteria bacterium]
MSKTILITGSTDGIGFEAARKLAGLGHHVLLHGRSRVKLEQARASVSTSCGHGRVGGYLADLSRMDDVEAFAKAVIENCPTLDVLVNNAGVFSATNPMTEDALDVRFVVNAVAPYLLTQRLTPILGVSGRVINVSSAAQMPVDSRALHGQVGLTDGEAYAQSKLALTMWSHALGLSVQGQGPAIVAVNPGSLLASKMVRQAFGIAGKDIQIGADILAQAALDGVFEEASGQYFDNDVGKFAPPHPDALDAKKCTAIVRELDAILGRLSC